MEKAKEAMDYCRDIGIFTTVACIIGFPDETQAELKQTVKYMQELNATAKFVNFMGVLPKSVLYDEMITSGKMEIPQSYMKWEELKWADHLSKNFSCIPDKELLVVWACFSWSVLFVKTPNGVGKKESRAVFKKAARQMFDIFKSGTFYSMRLIFIAVKELLQIFYYAKMFPIIRKKYGL